MTLTALCTRYHAALEAGNLQAVLALFDPEAVIVSPLYGTVEAGKFYARLFADTCRSVTKLLNIFYAGNDSPSVALHFHYSWKLQRGKTVEFECVDVFELSQDRTRFKKLTIIYDTHPLRADF
jgi:hypothetical protein